MRDICEHNNIHAIVCLNKVDLVNYEEKEEIKDKKKDSKETTAQKSETTTAAQKSTTAAQKSTTAKKSAAVKSQGSTGN